MRGDVLPVGGIGEKVLAALRAGIRELILPVLNEKDVLEIPEDIREGVIFHVITSYSIHYTKLYDFLVRMIKPSRTPSSLQRNNFV